MWAGCAMLGAKQIVPYGGRAGPPPPVALPQRGWLAEPTMDPRGLCRPRGTPQRNARGQSGYLSRFVAPGGFCSGFVASGFWSPITLLSGQTEKAGHFLQPATTAMGHSVI